MGAQGGRLWGLLVAALAALIAAMCVYLWFPTSTFVAAQTSELTPAEVAALVDNISASTEEVSVDPASSTLAVTSSGGSPRTVQVPPQQLVSVALALRDTGVEVAWPEGVEGPSAKQVQQHSPLLSAARWVLASLLVGIALFLLISLMYRWRSGERFSKDFASKCEVPDTRFSDVAGADEAVAQLDEVVSFLKEPERLLGLGVKPPKGALLVGPPGTGKTLLARAVAGEADAAFFAASGSDFMERLVGVGSARIRELFRTASRQPRAIIFIDEIDAIGGERQGADGIGSSESDHTLVALLAELDGFHPRGNLVVIAATNRPDILDSALMRPGRLDRRVEVPLPDRRGREQILNVHVRGVPVDSGISLESVARRTPGFSGAQLEKVVQEAALTAFREGSTTVTATHFSSAVAVVAMGVARTSAIVTSKDRAITAWHEAGHTVAALALPDTPQPVAVSIVPRGPAGGVTWMAETDDLFFTAEEARSRLTVLMAGLAAETLHLGGQHTQGPSHDLERATSLAESMVSQFGMSQAVPARRARRRDGTWDDDVQREVDALVKEALEGSQRLLRENARALEELADLLLLQEDVGEEELWSLAQRHGLPMAPARPAGPPHQNREPASTHRPAPSGPPRPATSPAPPRRRFAVAASVRAALARRGASEAR